MREKRLVADLIRMFAQAAEEAVDDSMTPEEEAELERIQRQKRKISVNVTGAVPIRLEAAVPCSRYTYLDLRITPLFTGILRLKSEAPELNDQTLTRCISREWTFAWAKGTLDLVIEPIDPPTGGAIDIDYSFSGPP